MQDPKPLLTPWRLLALGGVLAAVVAGLWISDPEMLIDQAAMSGPWAAVGLVVLMVLHNFAPVPAELIAMAAGAVLGPFVGTLVIWIGAMLGAALAFWIARQLGRDVVARYVPSGALGRIDRLVEAQGGIGLLLARFVPLISFNLINYGAGLTAVSWSTFLWTTAIGILPITFLSVCLGASMNMVWPGTAALIAVAVVAVFWLRLWRSRA